MEDSHQGRTFPTQDRQKPDLRLGARARSENVQGQRRIFQISLGCLSAKSNKCKGSNLFSTKISPKIKTPPSAGNGKLPASEGKSISNSNGCDVGYQNESDGVTPTTLRKLLCTETKTVKPFLKISRGRGRGMHRFKASNPGELSASNTSTFANEMKHNGIIVDETESLPAKDRENQQQGKQTTVRPGADEDMLSGKKNTISAELPDLIKCQSKQENGSRFVSDADNNTAIEEACESDSYASVESGEQIKKISKTSISISRNIRKYQDTLRPACEPNQKRKPHSKRKGGAVKKSLSQNSISSSYKPRKLLQKKLVSKNKENPRQTWTYYNSECVTVPNKSTFLQSSLNELIFSKEHLSKSENFLREKTNVLQLSQEKSKKDIQESAWDIFPENNEVESKNVATDAISVAQHGLNKKDVEILSKKLESFTSSISTVPDATKESLAVENFLDQDNSTSSVLSSSVCARVAALYHTFQVENNTKDDSLVTYQNAKSYYRKPAKGKTNSSDQKMMTLESVDTFVDDGPDQIRDAQKKSSSENSKGNSMGTQNFLEEIVEIQPAKELQIKDCFFLVDGQQFQSKLAQPVKNILKHEVLNAGIKGNKFEKIKDNLHVNNLQLSMKNEQETFDREEKGFGEEGRNENPKSDLQLESKEKNIVHEDIIHDNSKYTVLRTNHEKFCQTFGDLPDLDECMGALKLESISNSGDPRNIDAERYNLGKEIKYIEKDGANERKNEDFDENKNILSDFGVEDMELPQKESFHSSDICQKSLSDFSSEPEIDMDSQSESEFSLPVHENITRSNIECQNELIEDEQDHLPVDPTMQSFSKHWGNSFSGYWNQNVPLFSKVLHPVEQMCLPAHEFNEHAKEIVDFLKLCSEKIKQRSYFYQGYWPLDVRIQVDLVHKIPQSRPYEREPELSRVNFAGYMDPYIPPSFPPRHMIWPSSEAWQEFQSQHMDASRADARTFYPPELSQPRQRPLAAIPPGFNPQGCFPYHFVSSKNLFDSMKRVNETCLPGSHTASELSKSSDKVINASSREEGNATNKQKHQQTSDGTPTKYNSSCVAKDRKESKKNSNILASEAKDHVRTSFGISAFLTPERLHNEMNVVQRTRCTRAVQQDHLLGFKPTLKRTSSNPEVDKSIKSLAPDLDIPVCADIKRQSTLGTVGIDTSSSQAKRLDGRSKCSLETYHVSPKKPKCVSVENFSEQVKENEQTWVAGSLKKIDVPNRKTLSMHESLAMGSNAPNWRDHCRPNGAANSSFTPFSVQFNNVNKYNLKRRSYCHSEMGRNTENDAKLQTTKAIGRRSDPGNAHVDAALARKDQWLTCFQQRGRGYQLPFIDTHCHIDFLYTRLGVENSTPFKKFRAEHQQYFPSNYEGCIAIFCNPKTFAYSNPHNTVLKMLNKEERVWVALGCHPKSALEFSSDHLHGLCLALQSPNVVALGEIGLDYSGHYHQSFETQKNVFIQQLNLALNMKLPLVIHCRDADDDCLEILQQVVPKEHKIHAHCFTRGKDVAQRWLDAFPNLWLGITPLVSYKSAVHVMEAVAHIPLERLLLETDAPYFVPGSLKDANVQYSYPGFALITAEEIAYQKGMAVAEVLKACRQNTKNMYGI